MCIVTCLMVPFLIVTNDEKDDDDMLIPEYCFLLHLSCHRPRKHESHFEATKLNVIGEKMLISFNFLSIQLLRQPNLYYNITIGVFACRK